MDINFIDRLMCSEVCPCAIQARDKWDEKYEEKDMRKRLRTYKPVSTPPETSLVFIPAEAAK